MTKQPKNLHVWKRATDDGRKREVRAQFVGALWVFRTRHSDETEWTLHEPPLLDDMEELYDVLFAKYQRKRVPWEQLVVLQRAIGARGGGTIPG